MKYNELDLYYQFINNAVQGVDTMKNELETSNIKEKFHQFGYKYTEQRRLILNVLLENPDLHLSSEDIYEYFKMKKIDISQSTVYRTLIVLEKMKIVRKVNLDDGFTRYELFSPDEDHAHHHLICTECGSITDIKNDLLEDLERQILDDYDFEIKDHCLKFFGLCKKCRNQK